MPFIGRGGSSPPSDTLTLRVERISLGESAHDPYSAFRRMRVLLFSVAVNSGMSRKDTYRLSRRAAPSGCCEPASRLVSRSFDSTTDGSSMFISVGILALCGSFLW